MTKTSVPAKSLGKTTPRYKMTEQQYEEYMKPALERAMAHKFTPEQEARLKKHGA